MDQARPIKPFDGKVDQSQLAAEWRKWKRGLEYFLEAQGITNQRDKRNQLLHLGGPDLQDIYDNLPDVNRVPHVSPDPPYYDVAIDKLDEHFQPTRMRTYERHVFRKIKQQQGEKFSAFVMRLRVQANRCEFDQLGTEVMESMIIDQIAEKCSSEALRKKILEKDRPLSEVVAIGKTIEDVELQCREMMQNRDHENMAGVVHEVHQYRQPYRAQQPPQAYSLLGDKERNWQFARVQQNSFKRDQRYAPSQGMGSSASGTKFSFRNSPQLPPSASRTLPGPLARSQHQYSSSQLKDADSRMCFACGRRGHLKESANCPAKEAQCVQCKRIGHFAKWCTKRPNDGGMLLPPPKKIRMVQENETTHKSKQDRDDICFVMGQNVFRFKIGGVEVPMAIDSGAAANLIDLATWEQLQKLKADVRFRNYTDREFKAYGSEHTLEMVGMFTAVIEAEEQKAEAVFYVAKDGRQCLLGDETAKKLKVLKIGFNVDAVEAQMAAFPKIKGVVVEIPINCSIPSVQQPYRRVPFALEDKIAQKLNSLLEQDIIERVHGPSAWVSPLVPILKDSGEIRLCVDMRRANQAVLRETHPLPIVEELFAGINGAVRFSKLDIKEAYHQVEISVRSREITTFITKQGLFR